MKDRFFRSWDLNGATTGQVDLYLYQCVHERICDLGCIYVSDWRSFDIRESSRFGIQSAILPFTIFKERLKQ